MTASRRCSVPLPAWATGTGDDSQQQAQANPQPQAAQETQPEPAKSKPVAKPVLKVKPVIKKDEKVWHELPVKSLDHPQVKWVQGRGVTERFAFHVEPEALTDEGQKLVTDYSTDLEVIQKEMQAKLAARREAVIQSPVVLAPLATTPGCLPRKRNRRGSERAEGRCPCFQPLPDR